MSIRPDKRGFSTSRRGKHQSSDKHPAPAMIIRCELSGMVMHTSKVVIMACAALANIVVLGCATVHDTYAPDGRKAYTLNCSGFARGWDKCFEAAGNLCGAAGYNVVHRSDEAAAALGGGPSGFFGGKTNERAMVVECKG